VNRSQQEFERRMHRVLAHIDEHLGDASLELADLAAVAHFSPFHFHRLFTAWMGETLGETLRRRRLEVAALRLLTEPETPVLELALLVGFGSGEAFARAFKQRFGHTPSGWRQFKAAEREAQLSKLNQAQRKRDQVLSNRDQEANHASTDDGHSSMNSQELLMNVTVREHPAVRVAYLRHTGPYGPEVHRFWQQHFIPFMATHQLFGRPIYGVSHDDPLICAAEKLRYDCCVVVDETFVAPLPAQLTTIAAGLYASLPFHGTSAEIGPAWTALMRDWLPPSGYQLDGRPTFEYYPPGAAYDEASGRFSCDIVIPVRPL
jgi:AraC family transcriptional regulator